MNFTRRKLFIIIFKTRLCKVVLSGFGIIPVLQCEFQVQRPLPAKRRNPPSNTSHNKKSYGVARSGELNNKWSLKKLSESAWNFFCYLDIDHSHRSGGLWFRKLVKEISMQLEPGRLVINVVAYGPTTVDEVPSVTQQTRSKFDFISLALCSQSNPSKRSAQIFSRSLSPGT